MIDIENKIIDIVTKKVQAEYPGCAVTSETSRSPSVFPCVNIEEGDNSVHRQSITLDCAENHANLMYEVTVYSNLEEGRKQQAKDILSFVDGVMDSLGFTRTFSQTIPNVDVTIYRKVARYSCVASKGKAENGKIIHTIYRS